MNALLQQLKDWYACKEGYEFSAKSGATTLAELWPLLQRPDWMLWLTDKAELKLDESKLRLFACDCAEQVLPLFERDYPEDKRPRQAIEVARRYALGQATDEERDAARAAAWAAAWDAARAAARDAAWAAAWAAAWDAAGDAAWDAARDAAWDAARDAAWAAARDAAGAAARAYQADRLRSYFPNPFEVSHA